jgi:hypothetical protein
LLHNFRGRQAASLENDYLRVTVLKEGGHIAEILDKRSGVNPLWIPLWPSIEPSAYNPRQHPEFGDGSDAKLLAGIMGHNLCLDIFGGPSNEEFESGITAHGEGAVVAYEITQKDGQITMETHMPLAQIHFQRRITLVNQALKISERVESLCAFDRSIAWTQHVTIGPPFLQSGVTQFRASATRSKVFEGEFGTAAYLKSGAEFEWPIAPRGSDGFADLQVFNNAPVSSAYTAHLMDQRGEHAFFVAFSPEAQLAFGYIWKPLDFPWLGIWEENRSRTHSPWNGATIARGMEFGVSPMPEGRREMIDRGKLFGVPTYRWLPAQSCIEVEYGAVSRPANSIPEKLEWPE